MIRNIVFYKRYFLDFFEEQSETVRRKIDHVLRLVESLELVPEKFLKHVEGTDGLYEIRVELSGNIYRMFCFFDAGKLVIVANGFQKKTRKTPSSEIQRALRIRKEYYDEKADHTRRTSR